MKSKIRKYFWIALGVTLSITFNLFIKIFKIHPDETHYD